MMSSNDDSTADSVGGLGQTNANSESLGVQDWGLIDYREALRRQDDLVGLVHQELARETLILCSHPPIVTLGRGTKPGDVDGWTGELAEISRGGRATYHGPSQIVAYPVIDLTPRGRDLHQYMRTLEESIVATLAAFGIHATGRTRQPVAPGEDATEATGVWVVSRKVASIGIGVRKWVSFHGLALNVEHDPKAFQGLKPCGFTPETMISMEEILGTRPNRQEVQNTLTRELLTRLSVS
ncbi:MAG: lipoyl(octanoyl) transferase LipB [Bdellovibrionaceae bacterium]|nr:lipoyl(octanoyl) transferase LipB [Pseudobdellovibrionaceae bacterium]